MEAVLGSHARGRSRALLVPAVALGVICIVGLGALGYRAAAASGGFAVERIDVAGDAAQAPAVRLAVRERIGDASLLEVDPAAIAAAVAALPGVRRATVDRAFPGTLAIRIVPERPAGIVATRHGSLVVSASGRVIGPARRGAQLPVLAAAPADIPGIGGVIASPSVLDEIAVASTATRGVRLDAVGWTDDGLVARLASGGQVRFGDAADLARKLRIARAVVRRAGDAPLRYVDVSVPDAPVLRVETADPLTRDAPPAPAPRTAGSGSVGASGTGTPAEHARQLFG